MNINQALKKGVVYWIFVYK